MKDLLKNNDESPMGKPPTTCEPFKRLMIVRNNTQRKDLKKKIERKLFEQECQKYDWKNMTGNFVKISLIFFEILYSFYFHSLLIYLTNFAKVIL